MTFEDHVFEIYAPLAFHQLNTDNVRLESNLINIY